MRSYLYLWWILQNEVDKHETYLLSSSSSVIRETILKNCVMCVCVDFNYHKSLVFPINCRTAVANGFNTDFRMENPKFTKQMENLYFNLQCKQYRRVTCQLCRWHCVASNRNLSSKKFLCRSNWYGCIHIELCCNKKFIRSDKCQYCVCRVLNFNFNGVLINGGFSDFVGTEQKKKIRRKKNTDEQHTDEAHEYY